MRPTHQEEWCLTPRLRQLCAHVCGNSVARFVGNPAGGLDSETAFSTGDALAAMVLDYEGGIVTGRRPLSDLNELRDRWRKGGGDQMRSELEAQLS